MSESQIDTVGVWNAAQNLAKLLSGRTYELRVVTTVFPDKLEPRDEDSNSILSVGA